MSSSHAQEYVEVDARGLSCPMPILKARQALQQAQVGQVIKLVATDPGSVNDVRSWVELVDNAKLEKQETVTSGSEKLYVHYIRKIK